MIQNNTRTFVLLKPDAIERGLTGEILRRFERKGLRTVLMEMKWIDDDLAKKHYAEHQGNSPYFKQMCNAITCGPVIAMVMEGPDAVSCARQLIGNGPNPMSHAAIGTIRADFAIKEPFNLVHGSDSDHAAHREIILWFGKKFVKAENVNTDLPPEMPKIPKKMKSVDLLKKKTASVKFEELKKPEFLKEAKNYYDDLSIPTASPLTYKDVLEETNQIMGIGTAATVTSGPFFFLNEAAPITATTSVDPEQDIVSVMNNIDEQIKI